MQLIQLSVLIPSLYNLNVKTDIINTFKFRQMPIAITLQSPEILGIAGNGNWGVDSKLNFRDSLHLGERDGI
jgi:hypothetical protein